MRVLALACIAIVAFTAIAGVPMFAAIDALTPVDGLFAHVLVASAPLAPDVALPAPPVRDLSSPRAPPAGLT